MNIDFVSQMAFGDTQALKDFALVHRFVHSANCAAIQRKGLGATPAALVDATPAMDAWAALMRHDENVDAQPLVDWLQLHGNLHQAEYDAIGAGEAPDLTSVDFRSPEQFYDWMAAHQAIHDQVGQILGVT